MFYQMITNARNRWFASSECTAQGIIAYIEKANQMRDAQIDAIKTYLYLKIASGKIILPGSVQHFGFGARGTFCKDKDFFP